MHFYRVLDTRMSVLREENTSREDYVNTEEKHREWNRN